MSNDVQVACPKCLDPLNVRPEHFGGELSCGRCGHSFSPSTSDVLDRIEAAGSPDAASVVDAGEKVEVTCPGCRRTLKVRTRYLGSVVICSHCEQPFALSPSVGEDPARVVVEPLARPAAPADVGGLAARIGAIEGRLAATSARDPGHEAAEAERGRGERAALAASLAALGAAFEGFRTDAASRWEAERTSIAGEVAARIEAGRELARREFEPWRDELARLRDDGAEEVGRRARADAVSAELGSRVGQLEEAIRIGQEREARLAGRLDAAEADRMSLREEVDRLADQHGEARQSSAAQVEKLQAELASLGNSAGEHRQLSSRLESGLASLEDLRLDPERLSTHRAEIEAGQTSLREEAEQIRADLRQAVADRAGRDARLDSLGDRLGEAEAGRLALSEEIERLRLVQDAARREAAELAAALRSELASLRSAPASRGPTPPTSEGPSALSARDRDPWADSSDPDHDLLAKDILLDRLARLDQAGPEVAPAGVELVSATDAANRPDPPADSAEYLRLAGVFGSARREGRDGDAVVAARRLVEFTRGHFGERTSEHALWLRNLGMMLPRQGGAGEAKGLIVRASEICRLSIEADPVPFAICLIDLAELSLAEGDRPPAEAPCREALEIIRRNLDVDHPITSRAEACWARIVADDPDQAPLRTTSIATS